MARAGIEPATSRFPDVENTVLNVSYFLSSKPFTLTLCVHVPSNSLDGYLDLINAYIIPGLGLIKLQELRPTQIQAFYTDILTKPGRKGKRNIYALKYQISSIS